jgi:hypothetical protein
MQDEQGRPLEGGKVAFAGGVLAGEEGAALPATGSMAGMARLSHKRTATRTVRCGLVRAWGGNRNGGRGVGPTRIGFEGKIWVPTLISGL